MAKKRICPKKWLCEQLCFTFSTPKVVEEDTPVETVPIGHFLGIRMKSGAWRLTVGPELPLSMQFEAKTPIAWWRSVCADEFSLHEWDEEKAHIVAERQDVEEKPMPFVLRSSAIRCLRVFNEAYQDWRMGVDVV